MRFTAQITVFCLVLFLSVVALATEYHVNNDGSGDFEAIQDAIDAAQDGDTIIVYPGTYYENIEIGGRNIILTSVDPDDTDTVAGTIIDGGGQGSVVTFSGDEDETCLLAGFTVTNGAAANGGGILGGYQDGAMTNASIQGCAITGNTAINGGGVYGCAGKMCGCLVEGNSASSSGGGLMSYGQVERCVVAHNTADWCGGGVCAWDGGIINESLIFGNAADRGGGIGGGGYGGSFQIRSCTISDNMAAFGGGVFEAGPITNSIIWGNWAPEGAETFAFGGYTLPLSYCCVRGYDGEGVGNISDDPLFADPEGGDSHLQPYSPCIDQGDNSALESDVDLDMRPRIVNRRTDMGAYEHLDGCWIAVSTDDEMYWGSVEMALSAQAGAFGAGETVDLYAAMRFPDGRLLSVPSLSSDLSPWVSGQELAPGLVFMPLDDFSYRLSPGDPDGIYIIYAALFPHGSFDYADLLTNIASYTFKYHRTGTMEFHVKQDGTGDFTTIQEAIDASEAGDTIIVHPGTYYEGIVLLGKDITLRSLDPQDSQVVETTVIDGSGRGTVVTFEGTETGGFLLSGLTITSAGYAAYTTGIAGGGCEAAITNCVVSNNYRGGMRGCDGRIENCVITNNSGSGLSGCDGEIIGCEIIDNSADQYGGGLYGCSGLILNCQILNNRTTLSPMASPFGGGGLSRCNGIVANCLISGNSTECYGGGLYACGALVTNCVITGNYARLAGGGIGGYYYLGDRSDGDVINCTFHDNHVQDGDSAVAWHYGSIVNCIIWGANSPGTSLVGSNSSVSYSCVQNWAGGGQGNISDDPRFIDRWRGDYRLLHHSPCIDAGDNSALAWDTDADGNPRICNYGIDMGAYESPSGFFINLSINEEEFSGQEELMLRVLAGQFGADRAVDVYAAMAFPDGSLYFVPSFTAEPSPWYSGIVLGENRMFADSFSRRFLGSEPDGNYQVLAALTEHVEGGFGNLLTSVVSRPFKYRRGDNAEFHVIHDGTGDFESIQEAIFAAIDRDTIIVHPGTYFENIDFMGKGITILSTDPTYRQTVASTII